MWSLPAAAIAHGIWGHVHVTGWAIENLPPGELRDFFDDPEVRNAAHFGAAFTDSGYWPIGGADKEDRARAYGEHTHWEPFIADFVAWIAANDPPPWTTLDAKRRVAFLMGCAAHGLQDELFDSLFLDQVALHDDGSQDNADPASDGFLALDGHMRFVPEPWVPMDTLIELYAKLDAEVTPDIIEAAVDMMTGLYVNEIAGPAVARSLGEQHAPDLPWTRAHYLDTDIPGSLRAEVVPTGRYLEAIWERLHGRLPANDVVVYTFPATPRRLRSGEPGTPDSQITVVYGMGVDNASLDASLRPADGGEAIAHETLGTRWGAKHTRLHRLRPLEALGAGAWYTLRVEPGLQLIDGRTTDAAHEHALQVACAADATDACPSIAPFEPTLDGSAPVFPAADAGGSTDVTGLADAAPGDAATLGDDIDDADDDRRAGAAGCSAAAGTRHRAHAPWLLMGACLLAVGAARARTPRLVRPR